MTCKFSVLFKIIIVDKTQKGRSKYFIHSFIYLYPVSFWKGSKVIYRNACNKTWRTINWVRKLKERGNKGKKSEKSAEDSVS